MNAVECLVVLCCCTHVILCKCEHIVIYDTTLRQNCLRLSVFYIGIGVEVRVVSTDSCVLRVDTCAVCLCLVRLVFYIVVLSRTAVTIRTDYVELKSLNRAIVDFGLELHISYTNIDVVVVKLLKDVEISIVTSQSSSRIGYA